MKFKDTLRARQHIRQVRRLHRSWGGTSRLVAKGGVLTLDLDSTVTHTRTILATFAKMGEIEEVNA